jgi:hypothetical protein
LLFDLMLHHRKPSESVPVFVAKKLTSQQNVIVVPPNIHLKTLTQSNNS